MTYLVVERPEHATSTWNEPLSDLGWVTVSRWAKFMFDAPYMLFCLLVHGSRNTNVTRSVNISQQ